MVCAKQPTIKLRQYQKCSGDTEKVETDRLCQASACTVKYKHAPTACHVTLLLSVYLSTKVYVTSLASNSFQTQVTQCKGKHRMHSVLTYLQVKPGM